MFCGEEQRLLFHPHRHLQCVRINLPCPCSGFTRQSLPTPSIYVCATFSGLQWLVHPLHTVNNVCTLPGLIRSSPEDHAFIHRCVNISVRITIHSIAALNRIPTLVLLISVLCGFHFSISAVWSSMLSSKISIWSSRWAIWFKYMYDVYVH